MPKPYRGPDIRNEAQYEAASLEGRMLWHRKQARGYDTRLNALRTQHTVDLTDVENPIYKEMKYYQNIRNFHSRQAIRLRKCIALGKTECDDYYSEELEGENRRRTKLITTPAGQKDPYVELSQEAYSKLTDKQKRNYHQGMAQAGIDKIFHSRMASRIYANTPQPTFAAPKYGGESLRGYDTSKEEYENSSGDEKAKYHHKMAERAKREGDVDLSKWHSKMRQRIKNNLSLPTFYSPEDEQEEQ